MAISAVVAAAAKQRQLVQVYAEAEKGGETSVDVRD